MRIPDTLSFAGGDVRPKPAPTATLRENASSWVGLATVHLDEGNSQAVDGSLNVAISELQQAKATIDQALLQLIEAREQESTS